MISAVISILWAHFFADYVVQPGQWAENKWHSNIALGKHILVYMLSLFLWVWLSIASDYPLDALPYFIGWVGINGIAHFFTDYVTSRDSHMYWQEKDYKMFFITLGMDQLMHYVVLFITYAVLVYFII